MIHLINDYYMTADKNSYTVGIPGEMSDRRRETGRNAVVMRHSRLLHYSCASRFLHGRIRLA